MVRLVQAFTSSYAGIRLEGVRDGSGRSSFRKCSKIIVLASASLLNLLLAVPRRLV